MKTHIAFLTVAGLCLLLSGCASTVDMTEDKPYVHYLTQKQLITPTPDNFQTCRGYGCMYRDNVTLSKKEWRTATAPLRNKITTAEEERTAIAKAIGLMETAVGKKTGTSEDVAGTYVRPGRYQLDCVDESTNTTVYLAMMEDDGLFKFHKTVRPTARLPIVGGGLGPHQTAAIAELKSGERYAVDSWFFDNGHPASVAPMNEWKTGWRPQKPAPEKV